TPSIRAVSIWASGVPRWNRATRWGAIPRHRARRAPDERDAPAERSSVTRRSVPLIVRETARRRRAATPWTLPDRCPGHARCPNRYGPDGGRVAYEKLPQCATERGSA